MKLLTLITNKQECYILKDYAITLANVFPSGNRNIYNIDIPIKHINKKMTERLGYVSYGLIKDDNCLLLLHVFDANVYDGFVRFYCFLN